MDWKKIIPIVAVMAMMGVFAFAIQPATATKTTDIKVYQYDPKDPPGIDLGTDMYINKGGITDLAATLHVNGGKPQWFRNLIFYFYNSKGKLILVQEVNSGFGGLAHCKVYTKMWKTGTYKISIVNWGNRLLGYPKTVRNITLHIV